MRRARRSSVFDAAGLLAKRGCWHEPHPFPRQCLPGAAAATDTNSSNRAVVLQERHWRRLQRACLRDRVEDADQRERQPTAAELVQAVSVLRAGGDEVVARYAAEI